MESETSSTCSKESGVLISVSTNSDVFQNDILAPLRSSYLYEESNKCFVYKSAALIKNPPLEKKYNAFRAKKRQVGYSQKDLEESFGFLLFDDIHKAEALAETGVLTGNSTCTTLGDPSKGVYISSYSDCLEQNHWYHGRSGYIVIIRLTKGRVKEVLENYTQDFTAPTEGFDCHVSEQSICISARSSSFLAFEKTQFYLYELLDDGSDGFAQSPSAACPYAIISFSYMDTRTGLCAPQLERAEKMLDCCYFPWRGQLQVGTYQLDIGLRTRKGVLIPAELPPVLKVDRAMSMFDVRRLLPTSLFETGFSGEVFLDGFYCSLCELIPSEVEQTGSLSLLLLEIKEKDIGLTIPLIDGGFLLLLHPSHFLPIDETDSSSAVVLQGMFVFPDSRVVQKGTKFGQRNSNMPSEILQMLPIFSYADSKVERIPIPSENLCDMYAEHMQNYAALINPGLTLSPARNLSSFPEQYDVLDARKDNYASPEWTDMAWQSFKSYLSKPISFQLPVSKASEIMTVCQEEQIQDLDEDVYICLSSPEEASANCFLVGSGDQLPLDSCISNAATQVDSTAALQTLVPGNLQRKHFAKDSEKSDLTSLFKAGGMQTEEVPTPAAVDDLPTELFLSITSSEQTVADASVHNTESTTNNDFHLSGYSTTKSQTAGVNFLAQETVDSEKVSKSPEKSKVLKKTKHRKQQCRLSKIKKHASTCNLQTIKMLLKANTLKAMQKDCTKDSSAHQHLSNLFNRNTHWRKLQRKNRLFGQISKNKMTMASLRLEEAKKTKSGHGEESSKGSLREQTDSLKKKMECWGIKPVKSTCGRFLVPYGSVQPQSEQDEICPERILIDASVKARDSNEVESSTAPKVTMDETELTSSDDGEIHHSKVIAGHVISEAGIWRTDDGNGSLTSNREGNGILIKSNASDTCPLLTDEEKHADTTSPGEYAQKGDRRSVQLRRKRQRDTFVSEEGTSPVQDTEPCVKKSQDDSCPDSSACVQDANLDATNVSQMSVDPHFAAILGLTRKKMPDAIVEPQHDDTQKRADSSETKEQTNANTQHRIIRKPLPISHRLKIKTLKKHQSIPAETVREKWWLHFQMPAFPDEKHRIKGCPWDISVRKTFQEKSIACSSSNALNLLADLALSDSYDRPLSQADPTLLQKTETSFKKCPIAKNDAIVQRKSILHALLRQPAATSPQLLQTPPSSLLAGSDLIVSIAQEHAYSSPSSSSLVLDLSSVSFQVSPLSGSTKLLHHHHTVQDDRDLSVCQEDRMEHNIEAPEMVLTKHTQCMRKLRHSRTLVENDGSIKVTKQWKENYDFNLDSRFTSDSLSRTVIRALHGQWDVSIQDTDEETRLILHMWIGLFYSRSMPRFFHWDPHCPRKSSGDSESLEIPCELEPVPAQSELNANSFASSLDGTDISHNVISKAPDLSQQENSTLNQERINSDADMESSVSGGQKEENYPCPTPMDTLKSSVGPHNASTFQCPGSVIHHTEMTFIDGSTSSSMPLQKADCMENTVIPCFQDGGMYISVQEKKESTSVTVQKYKNAPALGDKLLESNVVKSDMKDGRENSSTTEMHVVQEQIRNSGHNETKSKDTENWEMKEKRPQDGSVHLSPEVTHTSNDLTKKDSALALSANVVDENATQFSKALSTEETKKPNEDVDSFALHDDNVIKEDHFETKDAPDENKPQVLKTFDGPSSSNECCTDAKYQALQAEQLPQVNKTEDTCLDLQLNTMYANSNSVTLPLVANLNVTNGHSFSEKPLQTALQNDLVNRETAVEQNAENCVCLGDLHDQRLPKSYCPDSLKDCLTEDNGQTSMGEQLPQTSQREDVCLNTQLNALSANGSEFMLPLMVKSSVTAGQSFTKEVLHTEQHVTHETAVEENSENFEVIRFETDFPWNETDLKCEKTNKGLFIIPFIGVDTSREDPVRPYDSPPKHNVTKVQDPLSLLTEPASPGDIPPTEVLSASQTEPTSEKTTLSLLNGSEPSQPEVFRTELHERQPAPTMDEGPHQCAACFGSISCSSSFSDSQICKNRAQKCLRQNLTSTRDEGKPNSTVTSDTNPCSGLKHGFFSMLENQNTYQAKTSETKGFSQIKADDIKQSLYQTDRQRETSACPGFGQQRESFPFTDHLQAMKPNNNQVGHEIIIQTNLSCGSNSHCPVMAVKPSRSDEIQTKCWFEGMLLEENEHLRRQIKRPKDCESIELSPRNDWLSNAGDTGSNSDDAKFSLQHPLHQRQEGDTLKFSKTPSSTRLKQYSEFSEATNVNDDSFWMRSLSEREGNVIKVNIEMDQNDCLAASTPVVDFKDDGVLDERLLQGSQHSLTFTILNTSQESSESFLEQLSKRCIQDDPTQASMEQECLIFSEQMKQLLKQSKRGPLHQVNTRDKAKLSQTSPMTLHFSSLEEQDDLMDHLDAPSLVRQKIQVDMSDRKTLAESVEAKRTLLPQKLSPGAGKAVENAAECARLYTMKMNDASVVKKIPSHPKRSIRDHTNPKTEPKIQLAFCNLNSLVHTCCKMKCRFFIFATSQDALFEETKEQLVAEGHTAMQPFEFFVDEDKSSPLLVILRNIDIAEHLCEVPLLLELKRSSFVRFVGIDEPNDVLNLTHQELLIGGGFIMFDRAALESLTLCNMKQMSEILREQSRKGKWKWMLHYQDSRRLNKRARLSLKAKEKTLFLNRCQEEGIAEVLPYHKCDFTSRDQPDYLTCLVHLQVQNISSRFPVFITVNPKKPLRWTKWNVFKIKNEVQLLDIQPFSINVWNVYSGTQTTPHLEITEL